MKKGFYYFGECTVLQRWLLGAGAVAAALALLFLWLGGGHGLVDDDSYFTLHNAWCLFFLLLSILSFVIDGCLNALCRDVATLLKEEEERRPGDAEI